MLKPHKLFREIKRVRNLWIEPPPRNRQLIYHGFDVCFPDISYHYSACGRTFTNRLVLHSTSPQQYSAAPPPTIEALLDTVGMVLIPYFFPLADFGTVLIKSRFFHEAHRPFWERFFQSGLGEFRYVNGLDPTRPVRILGGASCGSGPVQQAASDPKVLLLNGGGKDSAVCAEIFRTMRMRFGLFSLDANATRDRIADIAGGDEYLKASVHVDDGIQRHGRYRWWAEVPGAVVAFVSLIHAYLHGYRYFAFGNEYSASVANIVHRGMEINHQYCKSLEFEAAFNEFVASHLVRGIEMFSPIRPLFDLQVAQLFSRMEKYFPVFVSCNVGLHRGQWCGRCSKCAFVFLALSPFVPAAKLRAIFGEDLLLRREIRRHIYDMVAGSVRPWECIGTRQECRLALRLLLDERPGVDFPEWPRRRHLEGLVLSLNVPAARREYLEGFHDPHHIPPELSKRVRAALDSLGLISPPIGQTAGPSG